MPSTPCDWLRATARVFTGLISGIAALVFALTLANAAPDAWAVENGIAVNSGTPWFTRISSHGRRVGIRLLSRCLCERHGVVECFDLRLSQLSQVRLELWRLTSEPPGLGYHFKRNLR